MHDKIQKALSLYDSTASYIVIGPTYEEITWDESNTTSKPTEEQYNQLIAQVESEHLVEHDQIRSKRNRLLVDSDWTQLSDVPLTTEEKTQWATYRQELRDFPETCNPENPVWPTPPW